MILLLIYKKQYWISSTRRVWQHVDSFSFREVPDPQYPKTHEKECDGYYPHRHNTTTTAQSPLIRKGAPQTVDPVFLETDRVMMLREVIHLGQMG